MLLRHNVVKNEFINEAKEKKIVCYGAGKVFKDFLQLYSMLNVSAVIDKKLSKEENISNSFEIPIISLEDFFNICDNKTILIITCFDYQQVEEELNAYSQLKDLSCYVYCLIEGAFGIKDDGRISDKYEIAEFKMQDYNAGQKAPSDVAIIAAEAGYKLLTVNRGTYRYGTEQTKSEWDRVCNEIFNNSTILIQLPLVDVSGGIYKLIELKKDKNIKVIAVVHDIEILRNNVTDNFIEQYNMLKTCADIWIVHNERMKEALISRGFDAERIVSLQIFDYLITNPIDVKSDEGVIIAGNLDIDKSGYIYKLKQIKGVKFNLFGANYSDNNVYNNINYFGAFLPEELIKNLQGKYGLVWDGDSLDTCSGLTGEYLKVNNPHKLSLYLAVGLPVIIWDEAAEAEFVKCENVGLTVSSLYELPDKLADVSYSDYAIMKTNADKIGKRLRNGEYMTRALKNAEVKIKEIELDDGL